MMGRPMLRMKLLSSTPEQWLGRPIRQVADGDLWRFCMCVQAARMIEERLRRG